MVPPGLVVLRPCSHPSPTKGNCFCRKAGGADWWQSSYFPLSAGRVEQEPDVGCHYLDDCCSTYPSRGWESPTLVNLELVREWTLYFAGAVFCLSHALIWRVLGGESACQWCVWGVRLEPAVDGACHERERSAPRKLLVTLTVFQPGSALGWLWPGIIPLSRTKGGLSVFCDVRSRNCD